MTQFVQGLLTLLNAKAEQVWETNFSTSVF